MKSFYLASLFSLLMLLQACEQDSFEFSHQFEANCWAIGDTLTFSLKKENGKVGQIVVDLLEDYPYQNLYLKLFFQSSDGQSGEILLSDTLSLPSGEWLMEKRNGYYRGDFSSPIELEGKDGQFQCRLIQYMREERLCGFRQVAILPAL